MRGENKDPLSWNCKDSASSSEASWARADGRGWSWCNGKSPVVDDGSSPDGVDVVRNVARCFVASELSASTLPTSGRMLVALTLSPSFLGISVPSFSNGSASRQ